MLLQNTVHEALKEPSRWQNKFLKQQQVSIIGAPLNGGQAIMGCHLTPDAYREFPRYYERVRDLGWGITDCGNLDFDGIWENTRNRKPDPEPPLRAKDCHKVGLSSKAIADTVCQQAQDGNFVLTLGGDHSVAFGSLAGILSARPNTCVFWIDAHADLNTPAISPSGNLHGMPMGAHLGAIDMKQFPGWEWFEPRMHQGNIVFIGLRDLDHIEKAILKAIGAHVYTRYDIDKIGMGNVMKTAMNEINPFNKKPIHLSFDIDGMDPMDAPSTGTVSPGGLTYRESRFLCEFLASTGNLCSMDLVEINPDILQGALAGRSKDVITNHNIPRYLDEFQRKQLSRNPQKTLGVGWDLVCASLGDVPLNYLTNHFGI